MSRENGRTTKRTQNTEAKYGILITLPLINILLILVIHAPKMNRNFVPFVVPSSML